MGSTLRGPLSLALHFSCHYCAQPRPLPPHSTHAGATEKAAEELRLMEEEVKNGDDLLAAKAKELKDAEVTGGVIVVGGFTVGERPANREVDEAVVTS